MFDISGKRAIITGGAQGFGKQFARRLLQLNCRVCITDINENIGNETKNEFMKQFGVKDDSIHFIKFDVTEKEGWNRIWDEAEKVLGGKIEILANNAGISPIFGWEKCLDVMGVAAVRGVFVALERMSPANGGNGGRIINTASVAGIQHTPLGELDASGYSVAKHALVAMTRYFSEMEKDVPRTDGIKCYALAPYVADTALVRSSIEESIKAGKTIVHKNTEIRSISDYAKVLMRALTVEEVGEAFIQSIKKDKNGAVYAVFPDMPLIEYPNEETVVALPIILVAKIFGQKLGLDVMKPGHFYLIAGALLFVVLFFVHSLIGLIF